MVLGVSHPAYLAPQPDLLPLPLDKQGVIHSFPIVIHTVQCIPFGYTNITYGYTLLSVLITSTSRYLLFTHKSKDSGTLFLVRLLLLEQQLYDRIEKPKTAELSPSLHEGVFHSLLIQG